MMELENSSGDESMARLTSPEAPFEQQKLKMVPYYVCALNISVSNVTGNGL
jgi:hypothetical protein